MDIAFMLLDPVVGTPSLIFFRSNRVDMSVTQWKLAARLAERRALADGYGSWAAVPISQRDKYMASAKAALLINLTRKLHGPNELAALYLFDNEIDRLLDWLEA